MRAKMYMTAKEFAVEVDELKVFKSSFHQSDVEALAYVGLLFPRVRLRYPENIARRIYFESDPTRGNPRGTIQPDGAEWSTASELYNRLHKYNNIWAHGRQSHPFVERDGRYSSLLQNFEAVSFVGKRELKIDVSRDPYPKLTDDSHVEDYYSSWQVLLAAEVEDSGLHCRLNWDNTKIPGEDIQNWLVNSVLPDVPMTRTLAFAHQIKEFRNREKILDAATTFVEQTDVEFILLHRGKGGRFIVSRTESEALREKEKEIVASCLQYFSVSREDVVDTTRYLLSRWKDWNRLRSPAVCDAYRNLISTTVRFADIAFGLEYEAIKVLVQAPRARGKSIFDEIWPDWQAESKEKALLTLRAAIGAHPSISESDLAAFLDFLLGEGLESFFWQLNIFEDHALRGNEFRTSGMSSAIQGMAIVVEHVARAVHSTMSGAQAARQNDLLDCFKAIFSRNPSVVAMLKKNDIIAPARTRGDGVDLWKKISVHLALIRNSGGADELVADLVAARWVRGAVHYRFPEADHFEMEGLFVALMRAAFFCFKEVESVVNRPRT